MYNKIHKRNLPRGLWFCKHTTDSILSLFHCLSGRFQGCNSHKLHNCSVSSEGTFRSRAHYCICTSVPEETGILIFAYMQPGTTSRSIRGTERPKIYYLINLHAEFGSVSQTCVLYFPVNGEIIEKLSNFSTGLKGETSYLDIIEFVVKFVS